MPPSSLGGLTSPEYLRLNAQGKMPLLTKNGNDELVLPESDTICRYLLHTYSTTGPSFLPNDPKSNLIARLHDMYLSTIQGCLYKTSPPFGRFQDRHDALEEFRRQMNIIDDIIQKQGELNMYLCGSEVSLADATLFPTMVFAKYILPKFDGKEGPSQVLPKTIGMWYDRLVKNDDAFAKVHEEITTGLHQWQDNHRWDTIRLAGLRDIAPSTIFDKLLSGAIPTTILREDSKLLAFQDITPMAPAHVLIIPKNRNGLTNLSNANEDHVEILGRMLVMAAEISKDTSLGFENGARIVINDGKDGGQTVDHIHVHVLGGRYMEWPPG